MSIIAAIGRRTWSTRFLLAGMYTVLTVLGITMVVPFLITLVSSFANDFDYQRFQPLPRFLWSQPDRVCRGLVRHFNKYPKWYDQMACAVPAMPAHWNTWREAGRDYRGIDTVAKACVFPNGTVSDTARRIAADYSEFVDRCPVEELLVPVSDVQVSLFLAAHYQRLWRELHPEDAGRRGLEDKALNLLATRWGLPLPSFYSVSFERSDSNQPYWQQSWFPPTDPKYQDYLLFKELYRHHYFTPGIAGQWRKYAARRLELAEAPGLETLCLKPSPAAAQAWSEFKAKVAPAAPAVPFAMRAVWLGFLDSREARQILKLPETGKFDIAAYNQLAGTHYATLVETPFPVPADAPDTLRQLWTCFVETRFPVRLTTVTADAAATTRYQAFLETRFKTVAYANRMLETEAKTWADFALSPAPPPMLGNGGLRSVWVDFVRNLPAAQRQLRCTEMDYQAFLRARYGSLDKVNAAYGWHLQRLEEAFPPFATAYAVTFAQHEWSLTLRPLADNYRFVLTYLFKRGRALLVTTILIAASVLLTLTVNPMCAYALSRFGLRGKDRIILYLLATMAFPAMISAIPAYLLMRDLGMLNTFFALVLPGAANGMAIFMLKGFFDSLPPELYEAASIDGAKEWQIFLIITLPLMKPILAINALNAFIAAYNGWEWALIICQKQDMWTLSVWMYQANQMWSMDYPWIVTAGFVVVSIPTLIVFLFCQKIILEGIILPQMK